MLESQMLSVTPAMFFARSWLTGRARNAFRHVRRSVGSVKASLQENLSAVREAQAFNREEQNIESFSESNAASRDASIRAVAYTSALQPTLEALGYVAVALVAGIGGFLLLRTAAHRTPFLHVSCTEWKNMFSFEIYGRDGKIQIDGLGGSYGPERLAFYRMLPQMGPPETTIWEYPGADTSWAMELDAFAAVVGGQRTPSPPGLRDPGAKPVDLVSTETMILEKTAAGWRVKHIHWSSRKKE